MEKEEGLLVVRGRVEIDMRQPFRSVKEAVMLFGEKVLAGEIHAKQLQQVQTKGSSAEQNQSKFGAARVELEETKQSLQKAKEEGDFMAHCLESLREELEQTRREIQQLKTREVLPQQLKVPLSDSDHEIIHEELKFIEQRPSSKVEVKTQTGEDDDDDGEIEFEKKRSVKFASPPLLTKVINVNKEDVKKEGEKSPSQLKKKLKRKPLIPLIGAFFSKKEGK
ncbi:hypothetical protein HAX54_050474 [Datura stramonium]|uniref:WEB family protein n=1 Tax=Datura stramonium TaxID=4076 RepID=A0ABS8WLG6_DATST|nr:hypothetical protein [Datura stramonium]